MFFSFLPLQKILLIECPSRGGHRPRAPVSRHVPVDPSLVGAGRRGARTVAVELLHRRELPFQGLDPPVQRPPLRHAPRTSSQPPSRSPHAPALRGRRFPARAHAPRAPPPGTAPCPSRRARPPTEGTLRLLPLLFPRNLRPRQRRSHSPGPLRRPRGCPANSLRSSARSNSSTIALRLVHALHRPVVLHIRCHHHLVSPFTESPPRLSVLVAGKTNRAPRSNFRDALLGVSLLLIRPPSHRNDDHHKSSLPHA